MNKILVNIYCALIYDKIKRREIRKILLNQNQKPDKSLSIENPFNYTNGVMAYLLSALQIHQNTFSEYKNIYTGREVVIVGAGPTLNKYIPIPDAIHIGTNRTHMNKNLKLDFLFRQDFKNFDREIFNCNIKKFVGNYYNWEHDMCSESVFNKLKNAKKYIIDPNTPRIPVDLNTQPLWHGGSVVYSAMQFALWTNPKRIFIVGCDSAGQKDPLHWNHYDDDNKNEHNLIPIQALIEGWQKIADFAKTMYPDVEIISINPVGLKGLFKDIYQGKKDV